MTVTLASTTNAVLAGMSNATCFIHLQARGANSFRVARTKTEAEDGGGIVVQPSLPPAVNYPVTLEWRGEVWLIAVTAPAQAEIILVHL